MSWPTPRAYPTSPDRQIMLTEVNEVPDPRVLQHWKALDVLPWQVKCTILVIQLFLTNYVQAHDNNLEVLQHINLYLSTRRPQIISHPGHAGSRFFEIPYFQEFCLSRPRKFSKNRPKSSKNISRGCAPHPLLTGLRSSHPPS